jgi:PEP-CTERM motif
MNGAARRQRHGRARKPRWIAVFVLGALLAGSARVNAEPIKKKHDTASADDGLGKGWTNFLQGGPPEWATRPHPEYDFKVKEAIWNIIKTDPGGENPMIAFLLWKQSLDPTRFDRYHPAIGPAIDKLVAPQAPQTSTPSSTTTPTPTPTSTSPPTESQQLGAAATPEPATWLMTLGMAGWAFWRSRRRR